MYLILKDQFEFDTVNGTLDSFYGYPTSTSTTWDIPRSYSDPNDLRKIMYVDQKSLDYLVKNHDYDLGFLTHKYLPSDYIKDVEPDISFHDFLIHFEDTMRKRKFWGEHIITEFRAFIVDSLNPDATSSSSMFMLYGPILTLLSSGALEEGALSLGALVDPILDQQYDSIDTIRVHFVNEIKKGI